MATLRPTVHPSEPRRWLRRHAADIVGLMVVVVVVVLGYFEVPFEGRTFSTSANVPSVAPCSPCYQKSASDPRVDEGASAWQTEPWARVVNQALENGDLPLWNPYEGIGAPLAGDPPTSAFDPLTVVLHAHPTPMTADLTALGLLVLLGLGAYWAARMLALVPVAAVLAGSVYGLSGWFFMYSNNPWFSTYVYAPLLVGCVEWSLRSNRRLPIVVLGLTTAGTVLVGMPELAFISFVAVGVYAASRLAVGPRAATRLRSLLRLAGGFVLGLCLAAPMLVPFLEYLPRSQNTRAGLGDVAPATDSLLLITNWIMPKLSVGVAGSAKLATNGDFSFTRNWIGVGAAILVVLALSTPRSMREHMGIPVAAMGGVIVFAVYGGALTGWTRFIPFWAQADWQRFATPLLALAAALLAGIGVQALYDRCVDRKRFSRALGATAAVFAVVVMIDHQRTLGGVVRFAGGWPLALVVAGVLGVVFLRFRGRTAALVAVAVVIVELLLLAPHGFYSPRADPYPKAEWLAFLSRHTKDDTSRVFSTAGILFPNTAGTYGLADPRMLDALYVERYWQYIRSFVSYGIDDRFTATSFAESAPAIVDNPMFDLLGVRYVVFGAGSAADTLFSADGQYRVAYVDESVRIFENTHALPRAFVVHDARVVTSEAAARRVLLGGGAERFFNHSVRVSSIDPRRSAVVEAAGSSRPRLGTCEGAGDRAVIVGRSTTSVTLDVNSDCAGLLVVSDAYYPGWKATVRGKSTEIHATDLALRGVEVPTGRSRVVFRYEPQSFRVGLGLSVLGAGAIGLIAVAGALDVLRRSRSDRRLSEAPTESSTT